MKEKPPGISDFMWNRGAIRKVLTWHPDPIEVAKAAEEAEAKAEATRIKAVAKAKADTRSARTVAGRKVINANLAADEEVRRKAMEATAGPARGWFKRVCEYLRIKRPHVGGGLVRISRSTFRRLRKKHF